MKQENIRNFCIIAHIDHGKSTLADRILEYTGVIPPREMRAQVLDAMDLERERGITIKLHAVSIDYESDGEKYLLNLVDTPGHVDFTYEVSRSLKACDGALLVVDAAQGVEAQTVANAFLAVEHGLEIIPVINKIDLPFARPQEVAEEIEHTIGLMEAEPIFTSAKDGNGTKAVLDAIIKYVPPPVGDSNAPLQALIFDSVFDDYRGVIVYIKVYNGEIKAGMRIRMKNASATYEVSELGKFRPKMTKIAQLGAGEVGYLLANIKSVHDVKIGDTVVLDKDDKTEPLPGFKESKPMVFCGMYPANENDFDSLRKALEKLWLNDSSFTFQAETSGALGFGFRCGFLGLLHMEIIQERLERESGIELVQTSPNVTYQVLLTNATEKIINSPEELPDLSQISEFREPIMTVQIIMSAEYIGAVMRLTEERRATYKSTEYISTKRVILTYEIPFAEIIYDFYDKLKSATRGYGTMDYEFAFYKASDLVRLEIFVGGQSVDALSSICHRSVAERRGRAIIQRLRKEIPRHQFQIALQAGIGNRVIARENIAPFKKNVTAKCYGGDITRKRKLLEKQKEGKKRMKAVGNVNIPQEAFLSVLKTQSDE